MPRLKSEALRTAVGTEALLRFNALAASLVEDN
jgi:hypothetical protein